MKLHASQMAVTAVAVSVVTLGAALGAQSALTPDQLKYRPGRPYLDDSPVDLLPVQTPANALRGAGMRCESTHSMVAQALASHPRQSAFRIAALVRANGALDGAHQNRS